jgi:glycosyltransferase involved in cell wall biosynthesis
MTSGEPTFSVIIASYNRCALLREALKSVFAQNYPAHQVIVVDDGSTDSTAEMVKSEFPEVLLIVQSNLGTANARNRGVVDATGSYLCFLDNDDMWHQDKLSLVRDYIKSTGCPALNHHAWYFSDDSSAVNPFGLGIDFQGFSFEDCQNAVSQPDFIARSDMSYLDIFGRSYELLLERNRGHLSSTVIRKDIAITAGLFPPSSAEDWHFFRNVARITEWYTIPKRLTFTRIHPLQTTRQVKPEGLLGAYVAAWYDRPVSVRSSQDNPHPVTQLVKYRYSYREMLQRMFWQAIQSKRFQTASLVAKFGTLLLPRYRDRLFVKLPGRITRLLNQGTSRHPSRAQASQPPSLPLA